MYGEYWTLCSVSLGNSQLEKTVKTLQSQVNSLQSELKFSSKYLY